MKGLTKRAEMRSSRSHGIRSDRPRVPTMIRLLLLPSSNARTKRKVNGGSGTHPKERIEAMLVVKPLLWRFRKVTLEADHNDLWGRGKKRVRVALAFGIYAPPGFPTRPAIPPAVGVSTSAQLMGMGTHPCSQRARASKQARPSLRLDTSCSPRMPRSDTSSMTFGAAMFRLCRQRGLGRLE